MRELWSLDPDVIHLNHGSFGAVPLPTQARQQELRTDAERNPMRWFRMRPDRLAAAKTAIAHGLHTDPALMAMVSNASAGITVALSAIPVRPGQRLVHTDHAYGAVIHAVERKAKVSGAELTVVRIALGAGDEEVTGSIAAAMDEGDTAAVVVDQITSPTAKVMPVAAVAACGRERGVPVVVDGAHGPGLIDRPVVGDLWTGNLHKWWCAPRGSGVLAAAPEQVTTLSSPTVSWNEEAGFPASFDMQGTFDDTGWLAAPASIELLERLHFADRRAELEAMVTDGAQEVADAVGGRCLDVATPAPTMRVVELSPEHFFDLASAQRFQARLAEEAGVEVSVQRWGSRNLMRLSAHLYNTPDDYTEAARRLRLVLAAAH